MSRITGRNGYLDSRVIEHRIDELFELEKPNADDRKELAQLNALVAAASQSPDWDYGEQLIRDDVFQTYTEELINECYENLLPAKAERDKWPYRHVALNLAAAAEELKEDYFSVVFDGRTYWVRK